MVEEGEEKVAAEKKRNPRKGRPFSFPIKRKKKRQKARA